ncbi:MAG: hypothetical protein WD040_04455 [Anaerolineales bacterium]
MLGLTRPDPSVEPSVGLDHASEIARVYLGEHHAGAQVGEGISFSGYSTLHYEVVGKVAGMLSVNAYTGQVWEHAWDGLLVGISE